MVNLKGNYLNRKQAAAYLLMDVKTFDKLVATGRLPFIDRHRPIRKIRRFDIEDLNKLKDNV